MKLPWNRDKTDKAEVPNIDADTADADWLIAQAREGEQRVFELMREGQTSPPRPPEGTKARLGTVDTYARHLHNYAAALWRGDIDVGEFVGVMTDEVESAMRNAWIEGMGECELDWENATEDDKTVQVALASGQLPYIPDYAAWIVLHNRETGARLDSLDARTQLWINRWEQVRSAATAKCCGETKLEWVVDMPKESCSSCLRLNMQVRRASFWQEKGVLPRVPDADYLVCKGHNCMCSLLETEEACSKGPLPHLP